MMGVFVGTYWICYVLFLRKLSSFLVERDSRTQGRSDNVDHLNAELVALSEEVKSKKKQVQLEADKVYSSIKIKAAEEQANIVKSARDKAQAELKLSRDEIENEYKNELNKIKSQVPVLAQEIVARLLVAGKKQSKSDVPSARKELL